MVVDVKGGCFSAIPEIQNSGAQLPLRANCGRWRVECPRGSDRPMAEVRCRCNVAAEQALSGHSEVVPSLEGFRIQLYVNRN